MSLGLASSEGLLSLRIEALGEMTCVYTYIGVCTYLSMYTHVYTCGYACHASFCIKNTEWCTVVNTYVYFLGGEGLTEHSNNR